jgi:hypothetical protein
VLRSSRFFCGPGAFATAVLPCGASGHDKVTEMPRAITDIKSLARSHTRTALNVLVGVMRNTDATPPARIAAANAILDRGWGRAPQAIQNGDDGALELIHRIERVIVHPESTDGRRRVARKRARPPRD